MNRVHAEHNNRVPLRHESKPGVPSADRGAADEQGPCCLLFESSIYLERILKEWSSCFGLSPKTTSGDEGHEQDEMG
jgi:hypothetical protein